MADIPQQRIEVTKSHTWTRYVRVMGPEKVKLTADAAAAAVSLAVHPDHPSLANADKVLFGANIILTLTEACLAGDTTMLVTAIVGPLKSGDVGQRIVKDLSGYTFTNAFEVLASRGDATPVLTLTPVAQDDDLDPAAAGKADVAAVSATAAQMAIAAGSYYWAMRRANAGSERPLAEGEFVITERGFL